jgi:hypothetical protein
MVPDLNQANDDLQNSVARTLMEPLASLLGSSQLREALLGMIAQIEDNPVKPNDLIEARHMTRLIIIILECTESTLTSRHAFDRSSASDVACFNVSFCSALPPILLR